MSGQERQHDLSNSVAKINAITAVTVAHIQVGGGRNPVAVAVDFDGFIWTVNQQESSVSKLDTKSFQVVGEYLVGKTPDAYSDMTGHLMTHFASDAGTWRARFYASDAVNPFIKSGGTVTWTSLNFQLVANNGSYVKLRTRAADSPAKLDATPWGPATAELSAKLLPWVISNPGTMLEVELTLVLGPGGIAPVLKDFVAEFAIK